MHRFLRYLVPPTLALLGAGVPCLAQTSMDMLGSARASALGHGTTGLSSAVGVHANPAAAAVHRSRTATFYAREGFGLSVLRYGAAYGTLPFGWGTLSMGASTVGFDDYRELHFTTGYARRISLGTSRYVAVGVTARYYHTRIAGYGNARAVGLNLGLQVPLLPPLTLGAHATNVNGPSLVDDGGSLPRTLAVGLSYRALRHVLIVADVFKDIAFPVSVRGGIEIRPVPSLAFRAGLTTAPTRFTVGAGIRLGPLHAALAAEQHQVLGWSPSASLQVRW